MPKGPPRIGQRDCRFDHLVAAAIGKGYGVILVYTGIESLERGHDIRRGIYRCAKHREITAEAGKSSQLADGDEMGLRKVGDEYELRFRVWDKKSARAQMLQRYGTDRSKWPYDPRRKKNQEDIDFWAAQGLDEKGHKVK